MVDSEWRQVRRRCATRWNCVILWSHIDLKSGKYTDKHTNVLQFWTVFAASHVCCPQAALNNKQYKTIQKQNDAAMTTRFIMGVKQHWLCMCKRTFRQQVKQEMWSYLTQVTRPCSLTFELRQIYWRWRSTWGGGGGELAPVYCCDGEKSPTFIK